MVRSRRSISKDDALSVFADSGISLSSPPEVPSRNLKHTYENDKNELANIDPNKGHRLKKPCNRDNDTESRDSDKKIHHCRNKVKTRSQKSLVVVTDAKQKRNCASLVKTKNQLPKRRKLIATNNEEGTSNEQLSLRIGPKSASQSEKIETDTVHAIPTDTVNASSELVKAATSTKAKVRKTYICNVCQKEFGGNTDLKRHSLIHSDERPYKCEQCGKCYRQAVNLKNHMTTAHQGRKQFACKLCSKKFALKERLRLHMRLHSGEKPYLCNFCEKRFARGGQLQQHVVTHHKNKVKQYVCEVCSASFSSNANLRAHMERHEQGPDYFCEICNEHFESGHSLRCHINITHSKLRQFDCEVCKVTIEDVDLVTHMKTHSHIKLFVCNVCSAYFTQKSQYNVHLRMHTGERPYQCRICWQTFAHSSVLKLHIRKHTGEKPFRCPLCKDEVAFSQLAHLKTHMKKIHKQENPYRCEGCNSFFKIKVDLQAHIEQSDLCRSTEGRDTSGEIQTLSHLRFLLALLIKKISSQQKLQQLGYEKRLIDNVIVASLKLANRKACDDLTISAIDRIRLNVEELLNWIVPEKVMQGFRDQNISMDDILDRIVTMYMKQK